jgi:hypothetical protein
MLKPVSALNESSVFSAFLASLEALKDARVKLKKEGEILLYKLMIMMEVVRIGSLVEFVIVVVLFNKIFITFSMDPCTTLCKS